MLALSPQAAFLGYLVIFVESRTIPDSPAHGMLLCPVPCALCPGVLKGTDEALISSSFSSFCSRDKSDDFQALYTLELKPVPQAVDWIQHSHRIWVSNCGGIPWSRESRMIPGSGWSEHGTQWGREYSGKESESRSVVFATPWTIACQAPLSMEFSRPEYWIR